MMTCGLSLDTSTSPLCRSECLHGDCTVVPDDSVSGALLLRIILPDSD